MAALTQDDEEVGQRRARRFVRVLLAFAIVIFGASISFAQPYEVEWVTADNGGVTFLTGGTYTLGATVGQPDAGPALTGSTYALFGGFWATTPGTLLVDLAVAQVDSADPADAGLGLDYTVNVFNAGPPTAMALTVTDTLPSTVNFVSAAGAGWACGEDGGIVTCTRTSQAVGPAPPITISVTPLVAGLITNDVSVTATQADLAAADNTASEPTTIVGCAGGPPVFGGATAAVQAAGPSCGVDLAWSAATTLCGGAVTYSVYRDFTPGFTPSTSNRIATGLTATVLADTAGVEPDVTYYYLARATDESNGLEDANTMELPVTPTACSGTAPARHEFFNVRSGDTENTLNWVNPVAGFRSTLVLFRTDAFPTGPADPSATLLGSFPGTPGVVEAATHDTLSNGTTYYYAAFSDDGAGNFSVANTSFGRPDSAAGNAKWGYATDASALAIPGVIPNQTYYAVSNDRAVHGLEAGDLGGAWPSGWRPLSLGAAAQGRPSVVIFPSTTIKGSSRVAFVSAQDGRVHALDADTGARLWASPMLGNSGAMVQAAPAGMFTDFGGSHDLILVGNRQASGDSKFYGLNIADGSVAWVFDNDGGASGIGIITEQAAVDYASNRVYFASRAKAGGSSDTLWCLDFTDTSASKCWSTDIGDTDGGAIPRGGVLYVGNNAGEVHAIDMATGAANWATPYATGDGPVKSYVWPDFSSSRLYFSTTGQVHAIEDAGGSASAFWAAPQALTSPSPPFFFQGKVYVGAGDSRIYAIDGLVANPPAATSVLVGDPLVTKVVGSPSYDFANALLIVGTDQGVIYSVALPF